jgi:hypothetical protein
MTDPGKAPTPPRGRLVAFYIGLAVITAAVVAVVISIGTGEDPQPPIAGGYNVSGESACLGPQFDLKQSGQFVNAENAEETLSGSLRFEDGKLTGTVDCIDGGSQELDATVEENTLSGTLGGQPLSAELRRDPPPLGSARPRAPGSIAGEYSLSPRSDCLGGAFELEGDGGSYEILEGDHTLGELAYDDGVIEGDAECLRGGRAEITGRGVDRRLELTLEPAAGDPFTPSGDEGGTAPSSERVTANKQREFGKTLAAFFIAVAVVMLVARLLGVVAVKVGQPRVMGEVVAGIALGPTLLGAFFPGVQDALFPRDLIPIIGVVANLGLIFYMFLVGLELDPRQLQGRVGQAAAISNASPCSWRCRPTRRCGSPRSSARPSCSSSAPTAASARGAARAGRSPDRCRPALAGAAYPRRAC